MRGALAQQARRARAPLRHIFIKIIFIFSVIFYLLSKVVSSIFLIFLIF
jgi:hypothetical protein